MRSLDEIQQRWRATQTHSSSLDDLRRAVKENGSASPCVSGLRSVCWKYFLLSGNRDTDWIQVLRNGRREYARQQESLLRFIKHPEALTKLAVDPLADDPNSPWDTARQDEVIRAEIQQDVQRLPDEANYQDERIQTLILDALFIYCKAYPDRGGYRQGMHELLAPIVHVLEADAIDRAALDNPQDLDETLLELVDSTQIEHDAYLLFSKLMENAQLFYAIDDPNGRPPPSTIASRSRGQSSSIVERSKFIHEVCLQKVDPELAAHLISIEVLPQIFLIRWIRLLFSREFPFEQFLVLWDTIFAVDPSLDLVDLVCVAMLIRIRWQLLEADYSVCLQLLLKYPAPEEAHGPHTFVDDAVYLKGHLDASGGSTLITKYTGKAPTVQKSPEGSRPGTPSFLGFTALRQRALGTRSPLNNPPSFMNQQVGVEALFQGAAKGARGVLERGEKLGINQAVREAMGEIRRNMQSLNDTRQPSRAPKEILSDEGAANALAAMERRNQQLASMLDDTVNSLKTISASNLEDKVKSLELVEVAAAKIQFVKIYLEDSTMEVPAVDQPAPNEDRMDTDEVEGSDEVSKEKEVIEDTNPVDIKSLKVSDNTPPQQVNDTSTPTSPQAMDVSGAEVTADPLAVSVAPTVRPEPVPTRSTLAQSSFSFMLEPNDDSPTQSRVTSRSPPAAGQKKRHSNNASRERNAFLFGEVVADTEGRDPLKDEIFGLEPLRKSK